MSALAEEVAGAVVTVPVPASKHRDIQQMPFG